MDEEEGGEEVKLADGKVGRHGGLGALEAGDADANIGRLDHRHIVGTISNGQRHRVLALLDLCAARPY